MARFPQRSVIVRPQRRGKWGLWTVLVLLIVVAGLYTVAWQIGAAEVREGVDQAIADVRDLGLTVEADSLAVEGFPTAIRVAADRLRLGHFDGSELIAPRMTAEARTWSLDLYHLRLPEGGSVALGPLLGGAAGWEGAVGPTTVLAQAPVRPDGLPKRFDLLAENLDLAPRRGPAVTADRVTMAVQDDPAATVPQSLSLQIAGLTAPLNSPFGDRIESGGVTIRPVPAIGLPPTADRMAAWRDGGGEFRIAGGHLVMPGLRAEASGTLTLDAALQPAGDLRVTVADFDRLVDRLTEAGMLNGVTANLVRMAGRALAGAAGTADAPADPPVEEAEPAPAETPGITGDDAITIPLSIQDSVVRIGPIPVGRLHRIAWPE